MRRFSAAGLAMLVGLAACDDSPTGSSGDELTQQEAVVLFATVQNSGNGAYTELSTQDGQLAVNSTPTTITVDHESSHPCPQGGSVTAALDATLEFDEETQSSSIDAEGSLTHNACAVTHNQLVFTVDGDPNLAFELHTSVVNGHPIEFAQSATGAFDWTASDGRTGRCVVEYSHVVNFSEAERVVEGEVCGHTVRQVTNWAN